MNHTPAILFGWFKDKTRLVRKRKPARTWWRALVVGLLLTSWPGLNPAAPVGANTAADPNGLVVAIAEDFEGFDPAVNLGVSTFLASEQVLETLVTVNPDNHSPAPGLAENWLTSPDGLTWTFNLRDSVLFHDGTPLDAEAVVYNFMRWWDPTHPAHSGDFLYFEALMGGFKDDPDSLLTGIVADGPLAVKFTLTRPFSPFALLLSATAFSIASPAAIQAGTLNTHPVGSGPFVFGEYLTGSQLRLDSNPGYWGSAPQLASLTFQVIPDESARFLALSQGSVHVAVGLGDIYLQAAAENPLYRLVWSPTNNVGYLGINRSIAPLDQLDIRRAIAYAINPAGLVEDYYNLGTLPANQFIPPDLLGYNPNTTGYAYNPNLAQSLLEQAGFSGGVAVELALRDVSRLYLPHPVGLATALQGQLQAAGFQIDLRVYPSGDFISKVFDGSLELFLLGWVNDYPHPHNYFQPILCADYASLGTNDIELCNTVEAALIETVTETQIALYHAAGQRLVDQVLLLPLVHVRSALVTRSDVSGIRTTAVGDFYHTAHFETSESVMLDPAMGGVLQTTLPNGSETTVTVPAGAVTETVELALTPVEGGTAPGTLLDAGLAFNLEVLKSASANSDTVHTQETDFVFAQPVTITVGYETILEGPVDPDRVELFHWDGTAWESAGATCLPPTGMLRDLNNRELTVYICNTGYYALFGEVHSQIFLPTLKTLPAR